MRLILTSDLHQWLPKWQDLVDAVAREQPRFVLVAGDLLPKEGGVTGQQQFFPALRGYLLRMQQKAAVTVLTYLGNDDYHILEPALDVLAAEGLCVNLNGRVHREAGLVFCGMNKVRDYPFGYKHWCARDDDYVACPVQYAGEGGTLDEHGNYVPLADLGEYLRGKPSLADEFESLRRQLAPGELAHSVWMVHQPPSGQGMDILMDGQQVGSPTVLRFIQEHQPLLGCSGHIHESPYQSGGHWGARLGRTLWFQAGQMGSRLHYVRLDLDADYRASACHHSVLGEFDITV